MKVQQVSVACKGLNSSFRAPLLRRSKSPRLTGLHITPSVDQNAVASILAAPFACRPMTPGDLASISRLHRFAKLSGKPVFGSDQTGVLDMLSHAVHGTSGVNGIIIFSTQDTSDALGCITGQMDQSVVVTGNGSKATLVLLTLVVRADHRHQGAGLSLLKALKEFATERGVDSITTDVAKSNQPAIRFFKAAGFSQTEPCSGDMLELVLDLK